MKHIYLSFALSVLTAQGAMAEAEKTVVDKAGDGVKKGTDATVKGVKKVGKWVGKTLKKGGEKVEKASK
jgi:hypothetical protein